MTSFTLASIWPECISVGMLRTLGPTRAPTVSIGVGAKQGCLRGFDKAFKMIPSRSWSGVLRVLLEWYDRSGQTLEVDPTFYGAYHR